MNRGATRVVGVWSSGTYRGGSAAEARGAGGGQPRAHRFHDFRAIGDAVTLC